jgi:hypothetical protein
MKTLKGLTFAALNKGGDDPTLTRRAKLVERLEQQKALALNPTYTRTTQRWQPNEQGGKDLIEVQKRVRPWWQEDAFGAIALTVRYGAQPIEFEKGKCSVVVPAKGQLVETIDTIIAAVKAGELDPHLAQQAKARVAPKSKRAA